MIAFAAILLFASRPEAAPEETRVAVERPRPAAAPPAETAPQAAASVAQATPAPAVGRLRTMGGPKRLPVVMDGESIGRTPLDAEVACGEHLVRIGLDKTNESVDVPCGGERVFRYIVDGPRLRWSIDEP